MGGRFEVQWTKNDKFLTWGTEFSLYQIQPLKDLKETSSPACRLSNTYGAYLLASISSPYYVKCIDVYPQGENDVMLAIGQANGKVVLKTFGPTAFDSQGLPGKEFAPRYPRQCNNVAWNPSAKYLAAGLDKHRSDHAILLWDVHKSSNNGSNRLAADYTRPIMEYGLSETSHSMAWFQRNNDILASGMNMKNIKIIDFRDPGKAAAIALSKAIHGVCIDPNNDLHLASYVDNQIHVWDTRNFGKPVLIIPNSKPLMKIQWCPTKHNLLGALYRDSTMLNLYDIQHTVIGNEEVEPSVLEREVKPGSPHNLTSFTWHHSDEYRLLSTSIAGAVLDYQAFDRITINWAPNSNLVWSHGRKTLKYLNNKGNILSSLNDISQKMKDRAFQGYGLKEELWKNIELVDNEMLVNVWNWLHLSQKLVEDNVLRGYNSKHPGIRDILKFDSNTKSEVISTGWSDMGTGSNNAARIYKHEDRDKALLICGWNFDKDPTSLLKYLDQLITDKQFTKAATISIFNLKFRLAMDILIKGAEKDESLNIVAMALAGFSDDKSSLWRQFCSSPKSKLNDPYLRAMFAFLTAENFNYDNVLNESEISVDDRIALACIFLSDSKLCDYLKGLTSKLILEGNLNGIVLTGNSLDGIKLLQKYLDITGDIQSTVLITVTAFSELTQEVYYWIDCYRNLLDSWQLWNERALFDIMYTTQHPNDKPPQQVYVSCNFCGKSISAYMQGITKTSRSSNQRSGGSSNKLGETVQQLSSCPNCRKPLPRCVICLMHMGTITGANENFDIDSNKIADFANWFTWCQSCRHGGHSAHMIHWFKEHSECPVTACTCRCFTVNTIGSLLT